MYTGGQCNEPHVRVWQKACGSASTFHKGEREKPRQGCQGSGYILSFVALQRPTQVNGYRYSVDLPYCALRFVRFFAITRERRLTDILDALL